MTFCSLITQTEQAIAPGVYTAVRFEKESTDTPRAGMPPRTWPIRTAP